MMVYKKYHPVEIFTILAIFIFPVTCFTVRHGVHFSLFTLLLLGFISYLKRPKFFHVYPLDKIDWIILSVFSGIFFATLVSQTARGNLHFAAFDGPSRLVFGGLVFLFLRRMNIPYMKLLELSIPIGLIVILIALLINPSTYWGGRFATYFVDPNTLGSQSFILALLCFAMLWTTNTKSIWINTIQALGGLAGLFISVYSGSRGGWLAGPFIFIAWIWLRFDDISILSKADKGRRYFENFLLIFLIMAIGIGAFYLIEPLSSRIISGYHEITNWITGSDLNGSAGQRLSMWSISLELAIDRPWFGYGETSMTSILTGSKFDVPINALALDGLKHAGPHNDIFSKLLSLGIFGLLAYFAMLLIPLVIFWKNRRNKNLEKRMTSRIGLFYILGVFACGLANEQLSLKYLCSFYALMLAVMLAEVLRLPATLKNSNN